MSKDKRLILILAALLIAVFFGFFLNQEAESHRLPAGTDDVPSSSDDAAELDTSFQPRRSIEDDIGAEDEGDLSALAQDHEPVYGAGLYTATAQASFQVLDARHQPLPEAAELRAKLFRIQNGLAIPEDIEVNEADSRINCATGEAEGLEPGSYALQIMAGAYGSLWRDFHLAAGQHIDEIIQLETWTRVIRLRFIDENAAPVSRLSVRPYYTVNSQPIEARNYPKNPRLILRDPPGEVDSENSIGGGIGGSSGHRSKRRAYLTADGCWYLQVVAGVEAGLHVGLSKSSHGHETIELTSTFEGEIWNDYVVHLKPDPQHVARIARYEVANSEDPGNESAQWIKRDDRPREPDPAEIPESLTSWTRVLFRGQKGENTKLLVGRPPLYRSFSHEGVKFSDRTARRENGTWFSDIIWAKDADLRWSWNDGALLRTRDRVLTHEELSAAGTLLDHADNFRAEAFSVRIGPLSPTFDAWARRASLTWSETGSDINNWELRETAQREGSFLIETAICRGKDGTRVSFPKVLLRFEGGARWSSDEITLSSAALLNHDQAEAHLKLPSTGIAFRAVDEHGQGLPFVEASITDYDSFESTGEARRVLQKHGADIKLGTAFLSQDFMSFEHRGLDESSDLDNYGESIGEDIWKDLADPAARLQIAKNGAWYDSWKKVRGDHRGYAVDLELKLEAGKRHVLWLWSASRDPYEPDRYIVFKASEGLTDLGLIELKPWTAN